MRLQNTMQELRNIPKVCFDAALMSSLTHLSTGLEDPP